MVSATFATNQNFSRCSYSSVRFGDEPYHDGKCCRKCKSFCKGTVYRIAILTLKVVVVINVILFIVIPLIFKFSYSLQRRAVFLNFVNLPPNGDYSDPFLFDLPAARNLYLDHGTVKLGVWQILPSVYLGNKTNKREKKDDVAFFENSLGDGRDVILYNHGNAGSRATKHRVDLYKLLREFFHVVTYDYRGYGDSSDDPPSEGDVVSDSIFMVEWIRNKMASEANLFIWGHSLGTSITLATVSALKKKAFVPTGVFLESPFNNMREEIGEFPLAMLFKNLPWFEYCIVDPLSENGFLFQSDKYILDADCPILILHAEDDRTVPFKLGKKLYETAIQNRRLEIQGSVELRPFKKSYHYGHKYIVNSPELRDIVEKFIRDAKNETSRLALVRND